MYQKKTLIINISYFNKPIFFKLLQKATKIIPFNNKKINKFFLCYTFKKVGIKYDCN